MWSLWSKNNCSCLSLHWFYVVSSDPFSCPALSLPALGMPGAVLPLHDQSLNIQLPLGRALCFWLGVPLFLSNVPLPQEFFTSAQEMLKVTQCQLWGWLKQYTRKDKKNSSATSEHCSSLLAHHNPPKQANAAAKNEGSYPSTTITLSIMYSKKDKVQVLLPHDCTFAVRLPVLWASVYRCLIIFISIHTHIFSSEFKDKDISHSSQTAVSYVFHRSCKERELLNHEEALTMQTLLCKIAFKKHLLFMV